MPARDMQIVEVSPRDGLQNEPERISTEAKIDLIRRAARAGIRRIEATSFVHPKAVPQMADAEDVLRGLGELDGVSISALALNERGFDRALAAGVDEINFVLVATDTFSQRNQRMITAQGIAQWQTVADRAATEDVWRSVTIGAAFGCPFEGQVPVERLRQVIVDCAQAAPDEICLADTIGVAAPTDILERVALARDVAPGVPLRLHLHNTRNTGLANAYAAATAGVPTLDSSIGGIGGCPFAPNATGNIPTEDLVYMLDRMGTDTGVDLASLLPTAEWIGDRLGETPPGLLLRAGVFPSAAA